MEKTTEATTNQPDGSSRTENKLTSIYERFIQVQEGEDIPFINRVIFIGHILSNEKVDPEHFLKVPLPRELNGVIIVDQKFVVGIVESEISKAMIVPRALHALAHGEKPVVGNVTILANIDDAVPSFRGSLVCAPATLHSSGAPDVATQSIHQLISSVAKDVFSFGEKVCADGPADASKISHGHHLLPAVEACERIVDTAGPMTLDMWMDLAAPLKLELESERVWV
ncbi:hypothetical protein J8273_0437 [Carpediemonas membranifera]|uniref:Uncharacterized protein n=1 Tax=Carpediemonas membranifera TaxID=201153 RepID=A0A8J6BDH5_9EUKA|nr:hypothetical protein J8273_0437 [Carpediemonas membranifera]|eukprot:KAG9395217.1 hypothetical protein J8273_0437 [Carpediemonas membranifera]